MMKNINSIGCLSVLIIMALSNCKKPYNPPAIVSTGSYLVVEGVINAGSDSTIITLSRTVNLSSSNAINPVSGAVILVQSDQNISFPITETSKGRYVSPGLNLDNSHKYRLSIVTPNNEQYYSDFEGVLNSPPIDSIYFTISNNGININSATHDPANNVKYYRWDYQETWIFHSNYDSEFISNGDTVISRTPSQQVYTCWKSDTASTIVLGSVAGLSKAVITNNLVTSVASTSEKIGSEYSILVRQYALTADAYNFWVNLKKNTEELGGIFDAQPSQIAGNIHSVTNPAEPVIGYISVGKTTSQRIFIENQQLPAWLPTPTYPNCQLDSFYYKYIAPGSKTIVNQINEYFNYNKGANNPLIPISPIALPGSPIIGYTGSSPECVDCTLRGTNIAPSFWK